MVTAQGVFWRGIHIPAIESIMEDSHLSDTHCKVRVVSGRVYHINAKAEDARREILKLVDDQIEWWVERHARSTATEMHR